MQIRLQNIGIVQDSTIKLDGLTVVTGKNNSGKTTVGKALYSLLDGVYKLEHKARSDKNHYIRQQLDKVFDVLDFAGISRALFKDNTNNIFGSYPALTTLIVKRAYFKYSDLDADKFIYSLIDELTAFDVSQIQNTEVFNIYKLYYSRSEKENSETFVESIRHQCDRAIAILQQLLYDIDKDPELIDYARESINQTLRVEFANQIQPIRNENVTSQIDLLNNNQTFFHIAISDNNIVNDGLPVFLSSPYEKVYFIDDPFILDSMGSSSFVRGPRMYEHETILNPNRISVHNVKLKNALKSKKELSVFEQTVMKDSLKNTKQKIDQILPGTFVFSEDGEYYVQDGIKLNVSNLATGSKMFSIIKVLLEKGEIDQSTMLILDEPEAHLHPKWQNAFAEIIVLLVKQLGVNILLTTHSPNFMLALDAYMRKYEVAEKTNFYQTELLANGFVKYHCVNDNMGQIYQDFLQYLSEVKVLRNQYLYNTEG